MSNKRILYLFTRTPLHVGAGASVGAIDQPVQRERHTGFPVIPATSLKGSFADQWPLTLRNSKGTLVRLTTKKEGEKTVVDQLDPSDAAWLFGSDDANVSFAGALQFSEARLLAFPIRSARGSFAWITSPLLLQRAVRDGVLDQAWLDKLNEPRDEEAVFDVGAASKLAIDGQIVLEEYTFKALGWLGLAKLGSAVAALLADDPVWAEVKDRLVILSNGMMSYFAKNACEVAQHVRIDDETGTAAGGALFNQENVPSETLFYSVLNALDDRTASKPKEERRKATAALETFAKKVEEKQVFQFGGDASTGLGYCTVKLNEEKGA
jgi:CRISPR-associated protein Cmr4